MKGLIKNISFAILILLGFSSCIYDHYPVSEDITVDPHKTILFLDMRALNPSSASLPEEKIKSVRVIITGESANDADGNPDGSVHTSEIVECNRLYEFPIANASDFSYTLTWSSNLGQKSIFVIANEESISKELTDKLNGYEEMSEAGDLEEWLESYSFTPKYQQSDNTIYLPYTYSKTDFMPVAGQVNAINCWLVPVATKFVFHFENKRDADVRINGISMAYANSENYLLANIAPDARYMELGGESLYWPDWLAEVSKMSWDHPEFGDNDNFNRQYGWITDYSVPNPSDYHVFDFILQNGPDTFTVPAAKEVDTEDGKETEPGTYTTSIYYLPESINFITPEDPSAQDLTDSGEEKPDQTYYLTILLEDTGSGKAPKFENMPIPNLNALFRNTFVVIQMVMGQGDIEIYAEIAPWNKKTANGWVSEGSAPGNNPF